MPDRSSTRRRALAIASMAVGAVSLSLAVPGMVADAGANIANPGNVKISMTVSLLTPSLTLSRATGVTARATIQPNGSFVIPRSALTFRRVFLNVGPPRPAIGPVAVQLVAMSDFSGALDPTTHVESLSGSFEMQWSQIVSLSTPMASCPVGPFDVHLTTNSAGGRAYVTSTGTARMVDGNYAIDALTPGTNGCAGLESLLNTTLSLPITTTTTTGSTTSTSTTTTTAPPGSSPFANVPVPAVVVSTRLDPAPYAPPPPTTQAPTTQAPTTTAAPTTTGHVTPTVAPAHSTTSLPHTPTPPHRKQPAATQHKKHHKHHKKQAVSSHKRRHPKLHPKLPNGPHPTARHAAALTPNATPRPHPTFLRPALRPATRARIPQAHPTTIHAELASSRHRASPSALNLLALLALAISGAFAIKLMLPDFNDLRHSRDRRRGRLYGIEPKQP